MIYTPKQRALMGLWQRNELKRINLLEGSVSSGKTWISLVLWAFWVKTMPLDKQYMMCAKSLTTLKRNCLVLLQELVGERNFVYSVPSKEGYLFGRKILLEGASDSRAEAKIRGLTLQGAYCDELTQFPRDFFAMLLSRLRLPNAKLIATTNPDAPGHWLKVDYIDRAAELDFMDVKFLLEDNTTLPDEYVRNIKKEYSGVFFERFILGHWVLAEGIIYPMYEKALEYPPEEYDVNGALIPPSDYRLSIDYGTMNAFAALIWAKYGATWYCIKGYYYSGRDKGITKTDEEYADAVDELVQGIAGRREGEYIRKLKTIIDPSAASFITTLRKRKKGDLSSQSWYNVIPANNDVLDGIRDTATAMDMGLIKISPDLKFMVQELQSYVWDDKAGDDRPIKENDHAMDAMRYFVFTEHLVVRSRKRGVI